MSRMKGVFPEYSIVKHGPWRGKDLEGYFFLASAVDERRLQFFQIRVFFVRNGLAYDFSAESFDKDPGEFELQVDRFLRHVGIKSLAEK